MPLKLGGKKPTGFLNLATRPASHMPEYSARSHDQQHSRQPPRERDFVSQSDDRSAGVIVSTITEARCLSAAIRRRSASRASRYRLPRSVLQFLALFARQDFKSLDKHFCVRLIHALL